MRSYHAILLLGLVSTVTSNNNLIKCEFDHRDSSSVPQFFKEKYWGGFNFFTCRDWNVPEDKTGNAGEQLKFKNYGSGQGMANRPAGGPRRVESDEPNRISKKCFSSRMTSFDRRNPLPESYKRGPGFRSWGGKRNEALLGEDFGAEKNILSGGMQNGDDFSTGNGARDGETGMGKPEMTVKKACPMKELKNSISYDRLENAEEFFFPTSGKAFLVDDDFISGGESGNSIEKIIKESRLKNPLKLHSFLSSLPIGFDSGGKTQEKFSRWEGGKKNDEKSRQFKLRNKPFFRNFYSWGGKRGVQENLNFEEQQTY